MKVKNKKFLSLCAIACVAAVFVIIGALNLQLTTNSPSSNSRSIPYLTSTDVSNATTAKQYGILGYVDIDTAPGTPQDVYFSPQTINITLLVHFVSYQSSSTQIQIVFNPNSEYGLSVEAPWNGTLYSLNSMVTYNVSQITIASGQTIPVLLTIMNSTNFAPSFSIPVNGVGICINTTVFGDIAINNNVELTAYG